MESVRRITVVIVEDHVMVGEGLAAALSSDLDLEVVAVAATLAEGVALVQAHRPDVVLMDYRLPDGDGACGTVAVKQASPETQVVMLTALGSQEVLVRAIEAGCSGFLHKTRPIAEVRTAVRRAHAGEVLFSADTLADVVGGLRRRPAGPGAQLTRREVEVLALLGAGASTTQIAERLVVSMHTVRNHVRNILGKLGAHSKLEAVAIAAREGIVDLDAGR
jgi:DNA-binding NarL/FixJ family response regulator